MVADRGDHLVVRTPSNPGFYWGNILIFRDPPADGALAEWKQRFHEEIAAQQPARHFAFGWDSPEGERGRLEPFLDDGFLLNESVVLTADAVRPPPRPNRDVSIRPLASDDDWRQAVENQVACHATEFSLPEYREFKTRQMQGHRRMAEAGLGAWFGAFAEGRLVADLGCSPMARWRASRPWRRTRSSAAAGSAARRCTRAPATRSVRWARSGW